MTVARATTQDARWRLSLEAPHTLADDLGVVGSWVGPRKGPYKRNHGQKEDYVLRRLLVAWRETGKLRFPVEVQAEPAVPRAPDFVLSWANGESLAIEVTEAGEEDYQKWLTATQGAGEAGEAVLTPGDGFTARGCADEIRGAIGNKVEKFDRGAYRVPASCDLLVYDNTQGAGFWSGTDIADILAALGRPNDLTGRFREVHIVFGETVCLDAFEQRECIDVSKTYEIDYANWVWDQVERLRRGETASIDVHHIIEELESLGKSERRALASHFKTLLIHFLKWEFQANRRSNSWQASIDNARDEIFKLVLESPSLKRYLKELLEGEYGIARRLASTETGLAREAFPEACPYELKQVLDPEFMPGKPE